MTRITIVQPYVPKYRVPFFRRLVGSLGSRGIECVIAAAEPTGSQAARGDEAFGEPWVVKVPRRELKIGSRTAAIGGSIASWRDSDAVILGLEGSSLDLHRAMWAWRKPGHRHVGVWGHIRSYIAPPNRLDLWLERAVMRKSDQVFAYTPGGAAYARSVGVAHANITTVMNTVDVESLTAAKGAITEMMVADFAQQHGLVGHPVVAFIGGLDRSKRMDFLAEMLDRLWELAPDVRLLVGGRGAEEWRLTRSVERGQTVPLGVVDQHAIALIAAVSAGIVMPGRIGLIAVEALALELPLYTTEWPFHAPEAEYLIEGVTKFTLTNDPGAFAADLRSCLEIEGADRDRGVPSYPSLAQMVSNFADGVERLLP